ncbi:amino acid permease [Escherichia coli]|nr:amino acid permease [Escherichia coli]
MSNKPFIYQAPFPMGKDNTEYYLLTSDYVSVADFDGETILKVEPEALTLLAQQAFHDASFMLRPAHQKQVAAILHDPEASENDKYVALQFLRNSEIAAKGVLPTCQDTGTAIIVGKKGQRVWTGGGDEEALSKGVYNTYIEDNLRYSQNAPLDMYKEVNTGTNLPAQIDLYAVDGDEYKFLCVAKGGGSANKTYLYQVSFCAAAGCLGSLGGWTLLAGQTAKAAADDGLFPPIFARVNKAGTPVAGLIIVGILMTIFQLSSISPNATKEFGLVSSVSVIFTLVPYLYTCAALLLLGHGHFGKARPAYLAVTTIAFLYCIWAVVGSGAKEVMWSFVTLMVITAMYALNYNRLHKNPYPLDAPISKD